MNGAANDNAFESRHFRTKDGLSLHYRDYAASSTARFPVICLPGLTRNARDFERLAQYLATEIAFSVRISAVEAGAATRPTL